MNWSDTKTFSMMAGYIIAFVSFLYFIAIYPKRCLLKWANKRGFVLLTTDDSATERQYRPNGLTRFKVRVRTAQGAILSGFVSVCHSYAIESWEKDKFSVIQI